MLDFFPTKKKEARWYHCWYQNRLLLTSNRLEPRPGGDAAVERIHRLVGVPGDLGLGLLAFWGEKKVLWPKPKDFWGENHFF